MTATGTRDRRTRTDGVVRSQVDPRLVERRRRVADQERGRHRRTMVLLGIVVAVVAAMVGVLFSPLLDVDHIEVQGTGRLGVAQVTEAAGLATGDLMVDIDLAEARESVLALSGVRSARVTREWPSTVRIVVGEEQPLAEVRVGERRTVVSRTGLVMDASALDESPVVPVTVDELATVEGDRPGERVVPPDVLAAAFAVDRLVPAAREQVAAAHLDSGSLSLELTDGATVRFGPVEDLPAKLGAAEAVLTQVEPACRAVVDVREPSRVTVSRAGGCDLPPVTGSSVPAGVEEG